MEKSRDNGNPNTYIHSSDTEVYHTPNRSAKLHMLLSLIGTGGSGGGCSRCYGCLMSAAGDGGTFSGVPGDVACPCGLFRADSVLTRVTETETDETRLVGTYRLTYIVDIVGNRYFALPSTNKVALKLQNS